MERRAVEKGLLTVNQAAELLGLKASTIRAWLLRRKNLSFVRCGRSVRISVDAVDEFIRRNTVPAREPLR
jgi:excisionase family DNA binding protein